jgi:uncharacterized protein YceH (UPF0502 family)
MSTESQTFAEAHSPRWQPLEAIERRVLGVLIEKAKTTPENYPLSLNALRSGCNQKNNRAPLMQLEEPQIEDALDKLRQLGAIAVVQGTSRVDRYRHLAYEWLGVDKVELAVMAELLLRGPQTVGELRGRAARMEPIKDLGELRPVLDALENKKLIQYLTPHGRGSIVTHALHLDREMDKIRREAGQAASAVEADEGDMAGQAPEHRTSESPSPKPAAPRTAPIAKTQPTEGANWAEQIAALRTEINDLRQELASTREKLESAAEKLREELGELNRQLGN